MALSAGLLALLACPRCKGGLSYQPEKPSLDCQACALSYPVRDDIPVMLVEEAEKLEPKITQSLDSNA